MVEDLIRSKELRRLITAKCNKLRFEDVTEEEIAAIESIYLTGKFLGADTGIDLTCLELLPNLTALSISDMEIDQEGLDRIFRLKNLKSLEIVRSKFGEVNFPQDLSESFNLRILGCSRLPFNYPRLKRIIIGGCNVDFERLDLNTAETVNILESTIENVYDIEDKTNIKFVKLDGSELRDKEGKVVKNIKYPRGASYSHADVYRVSDSYGERE